MNAGGSSSETHTVIVEEAQAGGRLDRILADALPDLSVPTRPTAWPDPELVLLNEPLAAELGLDAAALSDNAARWFGGGALPEHVQPRAWAYAGHQFGHLTPRLGDGRAVGAGRRGTQAAALLIRARRQQRLSARQPSDCGLASGDAGR